MHRILTQVGRWRLIDAVWLYYRGRLDGSVPEGGAGFAWPTGATVPVCVCVCVRVCAFVCVCGCVCVFGLLVAAIHRLRHMLQLASRIV